MKWSGGLIMFVAISATAQFADLKPDPEQAWVRGVIGAVNAGLFITGLALFATGLKREILAEVRRERAGDSSGPAAEPSR